MTILKYKDENGVWQTFSNTTIGNADTLDGRTASETPTAGQIPVVNSNGGLDVEGDIYSNGEKVVTKQLVIKKVRIELTPSWSLWSSPMYYWDSPSLGSWPDGGFTELLGVWYTSELPQFIINANGNWSNTSAGSVRILRPSNTSVSGYINAYGIGYE